MPASMEAFLSSEVAVFTVCGLAALSVLVFLALIVLASFGVIDGKFLLELLRIIRNNPSAYVQKQKSRPATDDFFRMYGGHQR